MSPRIVFFPAFSLTWGFYDQHSLGTQFSLSTGQCIWGASCFEARLESGCCLAQGPSEARVCLCLLGPLPGTDWTLPPPRRHRPRSPRWPRAAGPKAACWAFPFSRGPGLFASASASFARRSAAGGRGVSPRPTALCVGRVRHSLHLRIGERTVFPLRFLAESSPATFSCWSCKH